MKRIKFKNNVYLTKTNDEAIIILDGETDQFWGMEGPVSYIIFSLFENQFLNIDNLLSEVLKKYSVSLAELTADVEDSFNTLIETGIAYYE